MTSELYERFKNPSKRFSPVPIWWWSGERLDPARLRWQLERFVEGGIYNLIVLNLAPTGPLYGADADDPPFFSEEWWSLFEGVCEDARELGVYLWFYDQIGFSGANLQGELVKAHAEYAGQALERVSEVISGSGELHCPRGGTPVAASVMPVDTEGNPTGEPVPLALIGDQVRWEGNSPHRLSLYYSVNRGFDYFSADACAHLLDTVHGEFERRVGRCFGQVIVGSFQDELPAMPTWSRTFAAEFARLRGYDLIPKLSALWEDYGPEAPRVRRDYHATRAELVEGTFFKPVYEWHEQRGLICGFDQQGPARAGYPIQTVELYADYQRTHRWFQAPGSDHHGEAKIHSSLAHMYGRPRVWIESFHSSGWGGTLEETFDWLLQWLRAGANLYDPHAVYYSTRGGWWEWAPPSTDWRQPYWKHYSFFARTVARLSSVLTEGHHVCEVGVLYPNSTVQAGCRLDGQTPEARAAHDTYLKLVGLMRWYKLQVGAMDHLRVDYDVLDDESIQRGEVRGAALNIGEESFKVIVLPACSVLEAGTAAKLIQFVQAGGRLIALAETPATAAGKSGGDETVQELAGLLQAGEATLAETVVDLLSLLGEMQGPVEAPVPTLVRKAGDDTIVFVPAIFPRATEMASERGQGAEASWVDVDYAFDPKRYAERMSVRVRGVQGQPELWEPYSGERRLVEYEEDADGVVAHVAFTDAPGVLLVWPSSEASEAAVSGPDTVVLSEESLEGAWTVHLEPTLDNRWGDFALPISTDPLPVECWRFKHRIEAPGDDSSGWSRPDYDDSDWDVAHVTFGPRALWIGPDQPEQLPAAAPDLTRWERGGHWREAEYSLSRGIWKDRLHRMTLGPKGHVPEEFLDFGKVSRGQAVQFRTLVSVPEPISAYLAVGAPASKRAWLNGEEVPVPPGGYLVTVPVDLRAGANMLELRLAAEQDVTIRAHYALVQDPARYSRPEWIAPADEGGKDSVITARRKFDLPWSPEQAVLQVGANAPCRVLLNGTEVGVQGGFDPYLERRVARLQRYEVGQHLRAGENVVELRVSDLGHPVSLIADALMEHGGEAVSLATDGSWEMSRDGEARELQLLTVQAGEGDPSHSHLWRRPHPLPASVWLEGSETDDGTVLPIEPAIEDGSVRAQWARFLIVPGALRMRLQVRGETTVYVDGRVLQRSSQEPEDGGLVFELEPGNLRRMCAVRVLAPPSRQGGAIFDAPISYEVGEGAMLTGNWKEQGLEGYSGGVRYTRTLEWATSVEGRRIMLDLGRVRGTAEVSVNDEPAGTRIWSPYVFDLTDHLHEGANQLEVAVYNTLGPYLEVVSPTRMVFPLQTESGIMGPVSVLEVE